MKNFIFRTFSLVFLGALMPPQAVAHPVSYKGALAIMIWNQPFMSDYWIAYSFAPNAAVAARGLRMEMPTGEYIAYFPQFDYLAKRWNNPDSQANIYVYGGAGGARFQNQNGYAGQFGIEADAESRSWFVMGKWESMWSNVTDRYDHGEVRLGLAPYEAEFNEIASWFMVQFQYHPTLRKSYAIAPLFRMFYRNVLWEGGVSLSGDWMINFMFHF